MKIAVIIDRMNVGGVEKIAIEQVRALRNLGEEATLVILRRKGVVDNAFLDIRKGIPTIYLDDRLPIPLRFSFKFPVFYFFSFFHISYPFFIPFVIKKNEFDYIFSHGTYTTMTTLMIKHRKKIPYSVFLWDPIAYILGRVYEGKFLQLIIIVLRAVAKFLDKKIIENADEVLVGGNAHNRYFKQIVPKVKIQIISPAVHPVKKLTSKKQNYVLIVTAWKKAKDPEYIFTLVQKLPHIKLYMVGKWLDPLYKKDFQRNMKKKFSRNITVVGEVSEKQLSSFYEKATVLLQTNDDRGYGMPALEAAARGTTFIIPKGQGVCEAFKDKIDGFFTKEKDTLTIVRIIERLLKNRDTAQKMGESAWKRIKDTYSWETHAKTLQTIAKSYEKK